jgi:hypothetical protein
VGWELRGLVAELLAMISSKSVMNLQRLWRGELRPFWSIILLTLLHWATLPLAPSAFAASASMSLTFRKKLNVLAQKPATLREGSLPLRLPQFPLEIGDAAGLIFAVYKIPYPSVCWTQTLKPRRRPCNRGRHYRSRFEGEIRKPNERENTSERI